MRERERFSPAQCRAARGLLLWTVEQLSDRADVEVEAVELFEAASADLGEADLAAIGAAFYAAGVIAIPEGLAGEGVRVARPRSPGRTAFASRPSPADGSAGAFAYGRRHVG